MKRKSPLSQSSADTTSLRVDVLTEEALQVRPLFSSESVQFRVTSLPGGREARRRHLHRSEDLLLKIVALPH